MFSTQWYHTFCSRSNCSYLKYLQGKFLSNSGVKTGSMNESLGTQQAKMKEVVTQNTMQERPRATDEDIPNRVGGGAPATK